MLTKTFVLENSKSKKKRHDDVQRAVREYLEDPKCRVSYDDNGRPTVENTDEKYYISVTTTGEKMLALLTDYPCGIDGEYLPRFADKKADYTALAERFFADDESDFVRDNETGTECARFVRVWVRKEAYVKCIGKGISFFPNFSVVENGRIASKLGPVSLKKFAIKFDGAEDYLFVIAQQL